jgi:SAM-dependent MidA family methyltransferase
MWERLGRPGDFAIVEQGAHDGAFAADVLGWCREAAPDFYENARYVIVEGFEGLRARQAERLAGHAGNVSWYPALAELPPFTGVHFTNELVDAFPVHLVRWRAGGWRELYLTGDLEWREVPLERGALLERMADVPQIEGYTTEVNLEALRWAEALAAKIERGWVLAVDYGMPRDRYYAPERHTGTLQCYAVHSKGLNPLANPGHCDLTSHVEFTSLANTFLASGMTLAGYTDQHHFLTGLAARAFAQRPPTPQESRGLKTLLHPEMLGTSFQVLCLSRNVPAQPLAGLQFARDGHLALGVA